MSRYIQTLTINLSIDELQYLDELITRLRNGESVNVLALENTHFQVLLCHIHRRVLEQIDSNDS